MLFRSGLAPGAGGNWLCTWAQRGQRHVRSRCSSGRALADIKAELIHAAELYLGVMAGDVVARVRQAGDAAQLLRVLGHWHMAMQDSKHGREAARALLDKTRVTLA